jgi:hypothetical protein
MTFDTGVNPATRPIAQPATFELAIGGAAVAAPCSPAICTAVSRAASATAPYGEEGGGSWVFEIRS